MSFRDCLYAVLSKYAHSYQRMGGRYSHSITAASMRVSQRRLPGRAVCYQRVYSSLSLNCRSETQPGYLEMSVAHNFTVYKVVTRTLNQGALPTLLSVPAVRVEFWTQISGPQAPWSQPGAPSMQSSMLTLPSLIPGQHSLRAFQES